MFGNTPICSTLRRNGPSISKRFSRTLIGIRSKVVSRKLALLERRLRRANRAGVLRVLAWKLFPDWSLRGGDRRSLRRAVKRGYGRPRTVPGAIVSAPPQFPLFLLRGRPPDRPRE